MDNINLTKRIMRRVYGIWFLRQIAPAVLIMPISLTAALWFTAKEFFVVKIIENFTISLHSSAGIYGVFNYIGSALYSAPILPLIIIGFFAGLCLFLTYRLLRNFKELTLVRI